MTNSYPISDNLTDTERQIVKASRTLRMPEVLKEKKTAMEIRALLSIYIEKSKILAGFRTNELDSNDRKILLDEMMKSLKQFRWLGSGELETIILEGLKGNLGETFGYNLKSLETWIKTYQYGIRSKALCSQDHFESICQYEQDEKLAEINKDLSKKKGREETMKIINQKIDDFKNVESWQDIPEDLFFHEIGFQLFEQMKLIELSIDEKQIIFNKQMSIVNSNAITRHRKEMYKIADARLKSKDLCFRKKLFEMIKDRKKIS